jgi:hypothetical protein
MSDLGNWQQTPADLHIVASRRSLPTNRRKPPLVADILSQAAPRRRHIVASRPLSPIHCRKPPLVADTLSKAAPRRRHIVASRPSSPTNCRKPPLVADRKLFFADYISGKNRFDNRSFLKKWLAQTLTIFL